MLSHRKSLLFLGLLLCCLPFFFYLHIAFFAVVILAIAARFSILFKLERLLLILLLVSLPFSIETDILSGTKIALPSEFLAVLLAFIFIFRCFEFPLTFWRNVLGKIVKNEMTLAVLFFISTLLFSSMFSSMHAISVKYTIVVILFILIGFGFLILCIHNKLITLKTILLISIFSLSIICLYVIGRGIYLGLGRNIAHMIPKPFFNDHTHFAATLLLFLPLVFHLWRTETKIALKLGLFLTALLFTITLILTHSRAAWLGAIVMLSVSVIIMYFKFNKKMILGGLLLLLLFGVANKTNIEHYFQVNRYDSNKNASSIGEQLKSVANLQTDVSNLERINRWKCALRMGKERPLFGFGPGTYQFQYFAFQKRSETTRISVFSPYFIKDGHGGTAHSEYLLSFSESGYPGLIAWIFLILATVSTFFKIKNAPIYSGMATAVFIALIGYFVLALFNNFLNNANFSIYFWMLIGLISYYSFQVNKNNKKTALS